MRGYNDMFDYYKGYLNCFVKEALNPIISDIRKIDESFIHLPKYEDLGESDMFPSLEEAERHTFFNGVEIKECGEVPFRIAKPLKDSIEICMQHIREFKKENYGRLMWWRMGPEITVDESNLKNHKSTEVFDIPVLIRYRIFVFKNIKGECY
jgi:hypothetical protein